MRILLLWVNFEFEFEENVLIGSEFRCNPPQMPPHHHYMGSGSGYPHETYFGNHYLFDYISFVVVVVAREKGFYERTAEIAWKRNVPVPSMGIGCFRLTCVVVE